MFGGLMSLYDFFKFHLTVHVEDTKLIQLLGEDICNNNIQQKTHPEYRKNSYKSIRKRQRTQYKKKRAKT